MNKILALLLISMVAIFAGCAANQTADNLPGLDDMPMQEEDSSHDDMMTSDSNDESVGLSDDVREIRVEGFNFGYGPDRIEVAAGERVRLVFDNMQGTHDFVVEGTDIRTPVIQSGQTSVVEFQIDEAGEYNFYCSVGSHRAAGMEGVLVVQ